MTYDPISHLGLSCHSGGSFYICQNSEVEFVGCCDIDPCGKNGECPSSSITPASFDPDKYDEIKGQSCLSSSKDTLWYTCISGPTFLGCCASNPCANDGKCPADDLVGAILNDNPNDASVFLTTTTVLTSASTSTSTSTSTSSANGSASTATATVSLAAPASGGTNQGGSSPSIGSIVGGVLGGLVALGLIAFISFRYGRRRRGHILTVKSNEDPSPTSPPPPWSPYHDSFGRSMAPPVPRSAAPKATTRPRSLLSLSSIIRNKRMSASKNRKSHVSDDHERDHELSPGFLDPVAELDGPPPGGIYRPGGSHDNVYYEIPGSIPEPLEPMAS